MRAVSIDSPPQDLAAAHAMIARLSQALAARDHEVERLAGIIKKLQRAQFGRSAEKLDPDQLKLALEDVQMALAAAEAEAESADANLKAQRRARGPVKRGDLPAHLPRVEIVVDIEDKSCPCCGAPLHVIGEDRAERLDVIPAQHRVLVTRRPKYGCRACTDGIVQAPAPGRLIESGLPTEAMIAHVLVSKYADHLPLYRQWQILARQGIEIDRSCLAAWAGRGAWALKPLAARMLEKLKASPKLFCDETRAPVLDPGRGRTKTGYLWAIARDDRPWNGPEPPGVVYLYAPGRGSEHALAHLSGFSGVLQVDAYAAYNALADPKRAGGPVTLAFCWAHLRRQFHDIAAGGAAPIAREALQRIAALYAIEQNIRGGSADARRAVRQAQTKPLVDALKTWLEQKLEIVARRGPIGEAIRYGLTRWEGFTRFIDDGRIEMDSNIVERSIRPIALNRKNALFAGSDEGGAAWGVVASLIETCKLIGVEPHAYLADVLAKLADRWPMSRLDELLPWAYAKPKVAVA
jgi:transposase